jgi:GDP-L-fucose synthase
MSILITGSDGFIGSNLKIFLDKSGYKIISPTITELDLRDPKAVESFLNDNDIDCIIHSATVLQIDKDYNNNVCEENLKMFFNLLRFKKNTCKLINLGSGSEYSRDHWIPKMNEDYFERYIPQDSHSLSKFISSKYIKDAKREDLYHLRIFGIFGPNEDYRYKFISNTIAKKLFSLPITINKNVIYDYLYIKDFSKIIEYLIIKNPTEKIFNVTPTKSIDLITIVGIIDDIAGTKSDLKVLKPGLGREYTADNQRLISILGNFEFTDIKKSISELFEFYSSTKHLIDLDSLRNDNFLEYAKKINP